MTALARAILPLELVCIYKYEVKKTTEKTGSPTIQIKLEAALASKSSSSDMDSFASIVKFFSTEPTTTHPSDIPTNEGTNSNPPTYCVVA
jgi:hypothetical protein